LTGRYDSASVAASLIGPGQWRPYPDIDERDGWSGLPEDVKLAHVAAAESLLGVEWPDLPATVFLEFVRTGNRSNFQRLQEARRKMLATLVLGEVFEDRGRFLDDIADGIWAISEESYWGVPAHLDLQHAGFGLPDVDEPTVDLFAAETGGLLAWTLYLLGDRLDQVSPLIRPRIRSELARRILDPNLERTDFWWMAFEPSVINNWTPWIASNWLSIALIVEDDPGRLAASVYKIMRSLDMFINSYPDDGGCDEGPVYWTRAGGSMFEVLDALSAATNGHVDIFDEPLIQKMGRYILKGHIAGNFFVNFADAVPRLSPPAAVIYRFGRRIGDDEMVQFAGYFAARQNLDSGFVDGRFGHLGRQLITLHSLSELSDVGRVAPLPLDVWLPDTEVMTARSAAGSTDGFFLAVKGGHNQENHNHNDVGNFIIYVDGRPAIIDLGPATYTRKTFSTDRYSIWNLQSLYHNVPVVNGQAQPFGRVHRARDVRYVADAQKAAISLSLREAYPKESGIESWRRSVTLHRGDEAESIELVEEFSLAEHNGPTSIVLMSPLRVELEADGVVRLHGFDGSTERILRIEYDSEALQAHSEVIELTDAALQSSWGSVVHRLSFELKKEAPLGNRLTFRFSLQSPGSNQH
jgi:hypothetical protein